MWTGGREFRNNYKIFKTIKLFGELGCLYSKIGAILIGCLFVAMLSESRELSGLAIVENYLVGFVIGIPMAGFFLVLARIAFGITKHGRRQVSNYTGSFV